VRPIKKPALVSLCVPIWGELLKPIFGWTAKGVSGGIKETIVEVDIWKDYSSCIKSEKVFPG
jgi:hypothetical protein